ncbi:MAG TPA: DUF2127 domain-containing protein, partial [Planctomycetota bacterium]|nr:DUF2127 domain-containing protein [Planctomycetota bacterium]
PELGERVIQALGVNRDREVARWFLEKLAGVSDRTLRGIGVGGLAYAVLQLAEGYGLFRRRVWAEWLTIVSTGSLIPFEVYEIVERTTVLKVVTLVVNALIVAYLIVRRVGQSRRAAPASA